MWNCVKKVFSWGYAVGLSVMGLAFVFTEQAPAQITLPSTGVTLADYIPLMVAELGNVVAAVVGAWVAFRILKLGLRWFSKAGG